MKLRTTTPASTTRFSKRAMIFAVAVMFAGAGIFSFYTMKPASADQYDEKIRVLQAEMNRYQAEANRLNNEAASLSNAIAQINNEKNALQAQIDVGQAQYDKLIIEIADTEKQIKENQDALGTTIADLYVDDSISPIEMIASSQNLSDFLNKQEYRNSVKEELNTTIKKVKDLKTQLTTKKEEVALVLETQKKSRDELAAKQSEQAGLLASTQNDEAKYQNMIKANAAEIARAKAAQAALAARANASGGYAMNQAGRLAVYESIWAPNGCTMGGPGGWYSYGGANGNGGDGRGYGCRQCASYAAWKVYQVTGKMYRWGNGGMFASGAIAAGYQNLGSNPQPGSLAVMWGNPGHVAWVEDVVGNKVRVTQYNWQINGQYGMYSDMWLNKSVFDQYVKID